MTDLKIKGPLISRFFWQHRGFRSLSETSDASEIKASQALGTVAQLKQQRSSLWYRVSQGGVSRICEASLVLISWEISSKPRHAAMSAVHDVRRALKPLGNLVHAVLPGPGVGSLDGLVPAGTFVTVQLNTADPGSYRDEIERLLRARGLTNTHLTLQRNPLYGQPPS
jgi:hypothetical protein